MNLLLLKQLSILSIFAGVILGLVTIIPYVSAISFFILIFLLSAFLLTYLKQNDLIGIISIKEGCIFGAVIGFVSFIAFDCSLFFISLSIETDFGKGSMISGRQGIDGLVNTANLFLNILGTLLVYLH